MSLLAARIRSIPSWQVTLGVALLALGFLVAAQLAAEGPRVRYTTQERSPLVETALSLQTEQGGLKSQIVALRSDIEKLEQQATGSAAEIKSLNDHLQEARIAAGLIPLTGTGLVIKLEDSSQPVPDGGNASDYLVGAADLRTVVSELWLAGAEAIAINSERITTSTAIIDIGGSVLINAAYVAGPFEIRAIGPTDLFKRLSASPGFDELVRARRGSFGIGISWAEPDSLDVAGFAGSVNLRESRAVAAPSTPPGASPSPGSAGGAQ